MLSLLLALVAAGCNAASSVLQRKANLEADPDRPGAGRVVRLMIGLLGSPAWLLGLAAMIVSFLLQATALAFGPLSRVEPVLVLELPLAVLLGAVVLRRPLRRPDWLCAALMALGLALFITVLAPSGGDATSVRTGTVVGAMLATIGLVLVIALAARAWVAARAALFGTAAGTGFGLSASLMKFAVARLDKNGAVGLFTAWETYAMVVAGIASVVLVQFALRAGTLVAAQPGITLLDPLVSVLWGTVVAGETTRTGPILLLAGVGAAMIVGAVGWLARSAIQVS